MPVDYFKKKLAVGIQARSTSTRFPRKVHALVCGVPVLDLVIKEVSDSVHYINTRHRNDAVADFYLLVPVGDEITDLYHYRNFIIEGPEHDVLARYKKLAESKDLDYVVRVTADCPLIPSSVITNVIKCGVMNQYDYCANFFEHDGELFRLVPDGFECEFFSRKMLNWTIKNATDKKDKEHVTTLMRSYPDDFRFGVVIPRVPYTSEKLSIDTKEDHAKIEKLKSTVDRAILIARNKFGKQNVHRF